MRITLQRATCCFAAVLCLVAAWPARPATAAPPTKASFDCGQATSTVERMVCDDPELAVYDRAVDAVYRRQGTARLPNGPSAQDRAAQRTWLQDRDKCSDRDCLMKAYHEQLANLFEGVPSRQFAFQRADRTGSLAMIELGGMDYVFSVSAFHQGRMPGAVNVGAASGVVHLVPSNGSLRGVSTNDDCTVSLMGSPAKGWGVETADGMKCETGANVSLSGFFAPR